MPAAERWEYVEDSKQALSMFRDVVRVWVFKGPSDDRMVAMPTGDAGGSLDELNEIASFLKNKGAEEIVLYPLDYDGQERGLHCSGDYIPYCLRWFGGIGVCWFKGPTLKEMQE